MSKKVIKLVSISEYARHWKVDRKTVYKLIEDGEITRYENHAPKLNLNEAPRAQKYRGRKAIKPGK